MGCYNMKCALTQLPVRAGDPVVLLFGVKPSYEERKRDYTGGFDYQPHFFKLITTPVYGEYNDYGWIENPYQSSMEAAEAFLKAVGYEDAIANGLHGNHWNDALSAMSEVIDEVEGDDLQVEVGYTFVHRKAWDNLLIYGREKLTRIFHPLLMDDEQGAEVAEKFRQAGAEDVLFDRYDNRETGHIEANMAQADFFKLAMSELPKEIAAIEEPKVEINDRKLTEEQYEIALKYARMAQTMQQQEAMLSLYVGPLQWLRPLFAKDNMVTPKRILHKRIAAVLNAVKTNPTLLQTLADVDTIFRALVSNQIVIRASSDLPTQSQESTYWGTVAITKAAAEIIYDSAVNRTDNTDDDGLAVVEALVRDELKSPY